MRAGDPRDLAPQFVLPLVVRVERAAPPERTDALEAAALAVLALLTDPRATGDGEWAAPVAAWTDARIRKVVRRARGAEWRRAEALDGLTVAHRTAEVRVFPPVPLDGRPRDLARLQVSGTDLDDPERPAPPDPGVPVLWLTPELELTAGKAMAQVGHARPSSGWPRWTRPPGSAGRTPASGWRCGPRTRDRWTELLRSALPVVRGRRLHRGRPGHLHGGRRDHDLTAAAGPGILAR